jgi:hypothetical protein
MWRPDPILKRHCVMIRIKPVFFALYSHIKPDITPRTYGKTHRKAQRTTTKLKNIIKPLMNKGILLFIRDMLHSGHSFHTELKNFSHLRQYFEYLLYR